jgi:hypothetical protein
MAKAIPQTWAKDPESGGADQSHYTPTAGDARPYADTDRSNGARSQRGDTESIMLPQNRWDDPIWGVNAPAGGIHPPETPDIPATTGE